MVQELKHYFEKVSPLDKTSFEKRSIISITKFLADHQPKHSTI
jgi:hypothetical protein